LGFWFLLANLFAVCQLSGMEQLKQYFATSGARQSALADKLGISRGYMSEIVGGSKRPGLDLAFEIEKATEGAVSVHAWARPDESHVPTPTEDAA